MRLSVRLFVSSLYAASFWLRMRDRLVGSQYRAPEAEGAVDRLLATRAFRIRGTRKARLARFRPRLMTAAG